MAKRPRSSLLSAIALLLGVACLVPTARAAAPLPANLITLKRQAEEFADRGQWADACRLYDEILKKDRNQPDIRDAYQKCLRHIHQARRHRDQTFRKVLLKLKPLDAADVYEDVLDKLRINYIDRTLVDVAELFRQGCDEFRFALEDELFLKEHLPPARREALDGFRARVEQARERRPQTTREARNLALEIAQAALRSLGLKATVVLFEFACGACNGLDEYTHYLTPGQLIDAQASQKGELVGIGVQLMVVDQKLLIAQVLPDTDAFAKRLRRGDRLLAIDGQPVEQLSFVEAATRLQGEAGSRVELVVLPPGEAKPRTVKVQRRPTLVPSVKFEQVLEGTTLIGLIRLLTFHENTVQEMRDALMRLQSMGVDVLILDLRGNPGGLFRPAVQVAELFLTDNDIVQTYSRLRDHNHTFKANNPRPVELPLVVLVDGETASSAEVVAGGLKENQRATLIGQTTFGKGSIQAVLPLEKVPAGIRITVAKFYAPVNNYAYAGRGVTPHEFVEAGPEAQLSAARAAAQRLAMMMGR